MRLRCSPSSVVVFNRQAHDASDVPNHVARVAEQLVGGDEGRPYAKQRKHTSETGVLAHEGIPQCPVERVVKIFEVNPFR